MKEATTYKISDLKVRFNRAFSRHTVFKGFNKTFHGECWVKIELLPPKECHHTTTWDLVMCNNPEEFEHMGVTVGFCKDHAKKTKIRTKLVVCHYSLEDEMEKFTSAWEKDNDKQSQKEK